MRADAADDRGSDRAAGVVLIVTVFVIGTCGLLYELVAGTLSSYLLGDSVTQFSLVIGVFLTSMGLGSWLSGRIRRHLAAWFVAIELLIGVVGGTTALVGFAAFAFTEIFHAVLFGQVTLVGVLVGLEIPLVIRILRRRDELRPTVARVMSADYLGAFAASLAFPFLLLPHTGLVRAGLLTGVANAAVAGVCAMVFARLLGRARRPLLAASCAAVVVMSGLAWTAGGLTRRLEDRVYSDEIVYAADSAYQRVVITRWRDDFRLYLNGHLQFSSVDEYRYHEALVQVPMSAAARRARVLVLGGGDGLAVRQVLRHGDVEHVDLVDLDPMVTSLFRNNDVFAALNDGALRDPRVTVHVADAMRFLEETDGRWDVILMDLPDPGEASLGKLYSRTFFRLAARRLAQGGALGCQCTSPFRSRDAFWCIVNTCRAARWGSPETPRRLEVAAYRTVVPTFGTWGFLVATHRRLDPAALGPRVACRYLTRELVPTLFSFPADMSEVATPVSDLDDPVVTRLYRDGYHEYLE